ncbi:MAG: 2-dehydropantoate 2-reductase N-terminal domain-containing protein [Hyphomicrobiaceae bacterium]
MDILIADSMGAGAAIGTQLAATGNSVTYLDGPSRAFALDFAPLKVVSALGRVESYAHHLEAVEVRRPFELVIVSVEAHSLSRMVTDLPYAIDQATTVLVLSPGLEYVDAIREACHGAVVLDGQHNVGAFFDDGGVVRHLGNGGRILIGARTPHEKLQAEPIVACLSGTGVSPRIVPDARHCRWESTLRFVSACGLAALLQCPLEHLGEAETGDGTTLWALLQECADVASANGFPVNVGGLASFVERLPVLAHGALTAMGRRIERGEIDEIVELSAQMQRAARAASVATPTLDVVVTALMARKAAMVAGPRPSEADFGGRTAPLYRRAVRLGSAWAQRKSGDGR